MKNQSNFDKLILPKSIINNDLPTKDDEEQSFNLEKFINTKYDNQNSIKLKEKIISDLQAIIEEWSSQIAVSEKKITKKEAEKYRAKLLKFGSYYLGVSSVNGDIDLICAAPAFIQREQHFFGKLAAILQKQQFIKNLISIKNAFTPIITFEFREISVDISLAILSCDIVPDNCEQNLPNQLFENMDLISIRSLNGRRNNQAILESVEKNQVQTLIASIKCIKEWAKCKGISDNKKGFLGGISWAIMVAKICQLFPQQKTNKIIEQFFQIYSSWPFHQIPIKIQEVQDDPKINLPQFNLLNFEGQLIILTPAYPCYNTTDRVNLITFQIIRDMIQSTNSLIKNYNQKEKGCLEKIFQPIQFETLYQQFIKIDIISNENEAKFNEWKNYIDYKLIILFNYLSEYKMINQKFKAHPYPESLISKNDQYKFIASYYIGIENANIKDINMEFEKFVAYLSKNSQISTLSNLRIFQIDQKSMIIELKNNSQIIQKDYKESYDPEIYKKQKLAFDEQNLQTQNKDITDITDEDLDLIDSIK